MTMYITDFLPLTFVVIYQHLISLLILPSIEAIKEQGGFSPTLFLGL